MSKKQNATATPGTEVEETPKKVPVFYPRTGETILQ